MTTLGEDRMDTQVDWYSEEAATFGDRLAAARSAAGMTQKELSRRVGVKLGTLRNWEDDIAEPRANKLSTLSGLLGVSLSWLLTGEGEGLPDPMSEVTTSADISSILAEMRTLRTEARQLADRLGILEKLLRTSVTGHEDE